MSYAGNNAIDDINMKVAMIVFKNNDLMLSPVV